VRAAVTLLIVLLGAGCQLPAHLFSVRLSGDGIVEDLPVTVEDRTDLIRVVGPAQPGQFNLTEGVTTQGDPSVLVVSWMGGRCDDGAHLTFDEREGAYSIVVMTTSAAPCSGDGVLRTVSLGLTAPVDPDAVTLEQRLSPA
jgi:hypothetical protein